MLQTKSTVLRIFKEADLLSESSSGIRGFGEKFFEKQSSVIFSGELIKKAEFLK